MLLEYGQRESDLRCMTMGHWTIGHGYYAAGNFSSAIECHQRAIQAAPDPLFASGAKLLLGMTYIADGQLKKSENMFDDVGIDAQFHGGYGNVASVVAASISIVRASIAGFHLDEATQGDAFTPFAWEKSALFAHFFFQLFDPNG